MDPSVPPLELSIWDRVITTDIHKEQATWNEKIFYCFSTSLPPRDGSQRIECSVVPYWYRSGTPNRFFNCWQYYGLFYKRFQRLARSWPVGELPAGQNFEPLHLPSSRWNISNAWETWMAELTSQGSFEEPLFFLSARTPVLIIGHSLQWRMQ